MTESIRFAVDRGIATITLDRQKALNALDLEMIRAMRPQLAAWAAGPAVRCVVVEGAGERAFCAGGDVVTLRRVVMEAGARPEPPALAKDFFHEEYLLNLEIHHYPRPYVALIDGITMGGGMGISVHGGVRVATERTRVAMPETGIGLFPDVGGGWFLPRMPGETGTYLALAGAHIRAGDTVAPGIATHFVPAAAIAEVKAALAAADWSGDPAGVVNGVLAGFPGDPGAAALAPHRAMIDACFGHDSVEAILAALAADGSDLATDARDRMSRMSPLALKLSLEQLRRGRRAATMAEVMTMEYRMVQHCMQGHDFFEGIRALLVDKDNQPRWQPATLAEVSAAEVAGYFVPVPWRELRYG